MTEVFVLRVLLNLVFWILVFALHASIAPAMKGMVAGSWVGWIIFIPVVLVVIFFGLYIFTFPGQLFLLLTGQLQWKQDLFVSLYQGQGARDNVLVSGIVDFVFWGIVLVVSIYSRR
jgi:hypothetical protein